MCHQTASHRDAQINTNAHTELAWKMVENSKCTRSTGQDMDWHKHRVSGGGIDGQGGKPQGSTIFLLCVVKLGWVPPTRPPFTEPLEEVLLLLPAVLCGTSF